MKNWLQETYDAYNPEWFFRVAGVMVGFVVVITGSWPGSSEDGYGDDLWPAAWWLYGAWVAVELARLAIKDPNEA